MILNNFSNMLVLVISVKLYIRNIQRSYRQCAHADSFRSNKYVNLFDQSGNKYKLTAYCGGGG